MAASVPATALFPVILLGLDSSGGGLEHRRHAAHAPRHQWYILFNVIAGAMAIPTDLTEAATFFRFTRWQRWRTLILPGIFPYLVTGMVTASGGAWNASIVAEYFHFQGRTVSRPPASAHHRQRHRLRPLPHFAPLRYHGHRGGTDEPPLWRRLYRLASTRFKLEA